MAIDPNQSTYVPTVYGSGSTGKPKLFDRLNKTWVLWIALAVAILTIWNTPGFKEQIAALITAPTLSNLFTLCGVLIAAFLLYVCKPYGVS